MKKISTLLICLSFFISVFAQEDKYYTKTVFGISMNTTKAKFRKEMSQKGHRPYEMVNGHDYYKTTFAGYTNVNVDVRYIESNDSVFSVILSFRDRTIKEKEQILTNLISQYSKKYPDGTTSYLLGYTWSSSVGIYITLDSEGELYIEYYIYRKTPKSEGAKPNDDI